MPRLTPRRRAGLTLVEMLVVLTIMGLLGSAIFRVFNKQQQYYKDNARELTMRRELRMAGSSLPSEMRSTSSAGLDVQDMQEGQVTFLTTFGSGVICEFSGGSHIVLPPLNAAQVTMTNWYTQPVVGDSIFIYDDSTGSGSEDDVWLRRVVTSVSTVSNCPGAPYTDPVADAGKQRWRIGISPGVTPTVQVGAVVRFSRPLRYSLYQASSGKWYLGFQEMVNGAWTTIEGVSGPFRSFQAGDANPSGLQFRYFDTLGVRMTANTPANRRSLSRIDVFLRTDGGLSAVSERRPNTVRDSLMMRVAVRNFK